MSIKRLAMSFGALVTTVGGVYVAPVSAQAASEADCQQGCLTNLATYGNQAEYVICNDYCIKTYEGGVAPGTGTGGTKPGVPICSGYVDGDCGENGGSLPQ